MKSNRTTGGHDRTVESRRGDATAAQAELLGIEIYPGFPAAEVLFGANGKIAGIVTSDMGVAATRAIAPTTRPAQISTANTRCSPKGGAAR